MVVILLVEQFCAGSHEVAAVLQDHYGFEKIDLNTYHPSSLNDAPLVGSCHIPTASSTPSSSSCSSYKHMTCTPECQGFLSPKLGDAIGEASRRESTHFHRHLSAICLASDLLSRYNRDVVITGIKHTNELAILRKRPFVVAVNIDASFLRRFEIFKENSSRHSKEPVNVEVFLEKDSLNGYGCFECLTVLPTSCIGERPTTDPLNAAHRQDFDTVGGTAACAQLCDFTIINHSGRKSLRDILEKLQLTSPEIFRPSFDSHFMLIAFEMATRSNCIRRSVGVVITSNNRVIATGYNGTPSNYPNCLEGGCPRCADKSSGSGENLHNCLCVHAEANALLQAGIDAAQGGALYTTSFPCLSCAKLIVQARIARVIFAMDYDDKTSVAELFLKMPIAVERHEPQLRRRAINLPLLHVDRH